MLDDLFSATVTVEAADADHAAMRARAYCVKRQKTGRAKVTGWFTTEVAATAWEAEFGKMVAPLSPVEPDMPQHGPDMPQHSE